MRSHGLLWRHLWWHLLLLRVVLYANAASGQAFAPSTLNFGSVQEGSSTTLSTTISNTRRQNITIVQTPVSGTGFSFSGPSLPITLAPQQNINLYVTFAPQSTGAVNGSMSVVTDREGWSRSATIFLFGTGTTTGSPPAITSPTSATGTGTTIETPPAITSATSASGAVGSAFSYQITATNSPTSYAATGLPAGLAVNSSTGLISGTPTLSGTSSVTINATNAGGTGSSALALSIASTSYSVTLSWTAPAAAGDTITGYNIFRSTASGGPYTQLNSSLIAGTTYTDTTVADGTTYYYVATAVGSSNAQSGYSNQSNAAIP
jgi:Abnormal spindle-like microcephaly-assoc'd, ASPM-SPD-2-Hydin/Putative Ig domain